MGNRWMSLNVIGRGNFALLYQPHLSYQIHDSASLVPIVVEHLAQV